MITWIGLFLGLGLFVYLWWRNASKYDDIIPKEKDRLDKEAINGLKNAMNNKK